MPMPNTDPAIDDADAAKPDGDAAKPDADKPDAEKPLDVQLADLAAKHEDLKRNSRTWEQRAKENRDKAKRLDELEAAKATPDQRLQAAETRAAKAERELTRYRVSAATGLPADLAEMLTGEDEDAMTEQAKKLLSRIAPATKAAPKPDHSQGGTGGTHRRSARDEGLAEAQRRYKKS